MTGEIQKVGDLILESLRKTGFSERIRKEQAVIQWPKVVGEEIAAQTKAVRIDGETLVVRVKRAAWRQQLSFLKAQILAKFDKEIGEGHIKDIRFI